MNIIQLKSVICVGCNLPNSLDDSSMCAFCRRDRVITKPEPHIVTRLRRRLASLIYPPAYRKRFI